jgi:hypothetical protein
MTRTPAALFALAAASVLSACGPDTLDVPQSPGPQDAVCAEAGCFQAEPADAFVGELVAMPDTVAVWEAALDLEEGDGIDFPRNDISIDVADVKDLRCRAGLACIVAGTIQVQLDIVVGDVKRSVVADSEHAAHVAGVRIEVLEASPYPGMGRKGEPKVVSLLVGYYDLQELPAATVRPPVKGPVARPAPGPGSDVQPGSTVSQHELDGTPGAPFPAVDIAG